jgi:hypothetical protein
LGLYENLRGLDEGRRFTSNHSETNPLIYLVPEFGPAVPLSFPSPLIPMKRVSPHCLFILAEIN